MQRRNRRFSTCLSSNPVKDRAASVKLADGRACKAWRGQAPREEAAAEGTAGGAAGEPRLEAGAATPGGRAGGTSASVSAVC